MCRSALFVAEIVAKCDFSMFKLLLSVFEWGSKSKKKAEMNLYEEIHPRLKKLNRQKKNRFLFGSGSQCGD